MMFQVLALLPLLVNGTGGSTEPSANAEPQCYVPWSEPISELYENISEVENSYDRLAAQSYASAAVCNLENASDLARQAALICSATFTTDCDGEKFVDITDWAIRTSLNAGELGKARDMSSLYEDTYLTHIQTLGTTAQNFVKYVSLSDRHFARCPVAPAKDLVRTSIIYDDDLYCTYWTSELTAQYVKFSGGPEMGPLAFKIIEYAQLLGAREGTESSSEEKHELYEDVSTHLRFWEDDIEQTNIFLTVHQPIAWTTLHGSGYEELGDMRKHAAAIIRSAKK